MSRPELIGETLGNYRIEEYLGAGGMGQVYRARHLHLDWAAAVKVLHPHLAIDAGFRSRFQQEARAVALLDHRNIVRLLDFGIADDRLYLVMELLTDGSLRSLLRERARPGTDWALPIGFDLVRQVAEGLAYAHDRGMVHRDIKPDNVLLKAEGTADPPGYTGKLADFGLARLAEGGVTTASGVTLGTPAYMSPEQCQGRLLDGRSDIYSLGIVLYEVITGRVPFQTRTLSDAIYNHVYVAPPPPRILRPDLSAEIEALILRCLAKHPDDRYRTVGELSGDLDAAMSGSLPGQPAADGQAVALSIGTGLDDAGRGDPTPPSPAPDTRTAQPAVELSAGAQVPRVYALNAGGEVIEIADLTGAGLTVGRLPGNELVIDVDGVSRHHLLVDWDGGTVRVTDTGSSNGTLLG
ncbi:MAG: protein kinase domain-containing protein, partial [Vicinamibacterales bacterium]